jgi:acetyl-CoA/propionyl-CoA carboxylase biotin carboxyl carrier protein
VTVHETGLATGNIVVVSTRDCSPQRRNQKLVEEAPAPFLTDEQTGEPYRASKAILREACHVGAGTCEFLVGPDGTISFLEVNTRLQIEHCVSEEVTGLDLVREQLRIAAEEPLGRRPRLRAGGPATAVHGAHPLDRDRVRQHDPAVQRRLGCRRGGRAAGETGRRGQ